MHNKTKTELIAELEDLRNSEQEYRILLDESSDPIFAFYPDGRYRYANREFANALRRTPDELIGKRIWDLFPQEEADKRFAVVKWVFENGETKTIEVRVPSPDGDRYYLTTAKPILDNDRRATSVICISKDITERKRIQMDLTTAKQAADEANQAKSRFLAAASHDLRQPLQAINLFRDALDKTGLSAKQQRISDYLSMAAHNLGDLLAALLDISRLDAGAIKPKPVALQSKDLFGKIEAEFAPLALAKSLRFKLYFSLDDLTICADEKLLQSLLGNLIGNAIKYTERGGVLVGLRRRGGLALIQIWDTGIGIAPAHIRSIFEEFFQVGNQARDHSKGLGLGLSIVKRLARLMDTEIVCRSQLGKGSVFEFQLPIVSPLQRSQPIPSPAATPAPPSFAGCHVLVIDDDLLVAKAIGLSLEALGMSVTTYSTGEDALADPVSAAADFYISDLRLPGLNGLQLLDAIQQRATHPIKALLLTGDTSSQRIELTRNSRWPVLFKPVELSQLLEAMERQNTQQ